MTYQDAEHLANVLESYATVVSLFVGGWWVYRRFIRQREDHPIIDFGAEVRFVGFQGGNWLVELIATIENRGKVRHTMEGLAFDLNAVFVGEQLERSQEWGGQVNFGHPIAAGSFLPERFKYFFVDPGAKAKYSFVTTVPAGATYVLMHCWFNYAAGTRESHTAETSVPVPDVSGAESRTTTVAQSAGGANAV